MQITRIANSWEQISLYFCTSCVKYRKSEKKKIDYLIDEIFESSSRVI